MTTVLALPAPETVWGRSDDWMDCEQCGGAVALERPSMSDSDPAGLVYDGDRAHCTSCGLPHRVMIDDTDEWSPTAHLSAHEHGVWRDSDLCPECGWPRMDHESGRVAIASRGGPLGRCGSASGSVVVLADVEPGIGVGQPRLPLRYWRPFTVRCSTLARRRAAGQVRS